MTDTIEKRACEAAVYVIETGATVRAAARHLGISKSTVHKELSQKLRRENPALYKQVEEVLRRNQAERHIRGGLATRMKYLREKQKRLTKTQKYGNINKEKDRLP